MVDSRHNIHLKCLPIACPSREKHIFFTRTHGSFKYTDSIYFFAIILFALYRSNIKVLGFSIKGLKKKILIGSASGGDSNPQPIFIRFMYRLNWNGQSRIIQQSSRTSITHQTRILSLNTQLLF